MASSPRVSILIARADAGMPTTVRCVSAVLAEARQTVVLYFEGLVADGSECCLNRNRFGTLPAPISSRIFDRLAWETQVEADLGHPPT